MVAISQVVFLPGLIAEMKEPPKDGRGILYELNSGTLALRFAR
jgi:hypothetical protein